MRSFEVDSNPYHPLHRNLTQGYSLHPRTCALSLLKKNPETHVPGVIGPTGPMKFSQKMKLVAL